LFHIPDISAGYRGHQLDGGPFSRSSGIHNYHPGQRHKDLPLFPFLLLVVDLDRLRLHLFLFRS
jgi:hypothetical protein